MSSTKITEKSRASPRTVSKSNLRLPRQLLALAPRARRLDAYRTGVVNMHRGAMTGSRLCFSGAQVHPRLDCASLTEVGKRYTFTHALARRPSKRFLRSVIGEVRRVSEKEPGGSEATEPSVGQILQLATDHRRGLHTVRRAECSLCTTGHLRAFAIGADASVTEVIAEPLDS
jgi:hypothetical protein